MTASCTVGIVTSKNQEHCRQSLFHFLSSLTYPSLNFIFATDDVASLQTAAAVLESKGSVRVIEGTLPAIRKEFLVNSDDMLFVVDGDVMGPKNIIEALIRHQKQLVCGVVLGAYKTRDDKVAILPAAFVPDQPGTSKQLSIAEIISPKLLKLSIGTASCLLAKRAAIEKFDFLAPQEGGDVVTGFFLKAKDAGVDVYLDTLVKCMRLPFAPGDERNKQFDARNYSIKVKAKLADTNNSTQ